MATKQVKVVSIVEKYQAEYAELFAERRETKVKSRVFDIMGSLDAVTDKLEALNTQKAMLEEQKTNLEAELANL